MEKPAAMQKKMTPDPPYLIFRWLVLLCIDNYDSEQKTHFAAFCDIYQICFL